MSMNYAKLSREEGSGARTAHKNAKLPANASQSTTQEQRAIFHSRTHFRLDRLSSLVASNSLAFSFFVFPSFPIVLEQTFVIV